MDLTFFVGEVIAVDSQFKDARGVNVPVVFVKSFLDGAIIPIQWTPIGADQNMPMNGQQVLYYRIGTYDTKIVCFHGNNPAHVRKGKFGLDEGEAVVQSDAGLGFFKAGQDGSVALVTGDVTSSIDGNDSGWNIKGPNILLETFGRVSISLKEDGTLTVQRTSEKGEVKAKIELDTKDNVSIEALGNLVVKAKQIRLDGEVFLGPGASDPTKSQKFGNLVTTGPFGTYPLDFVTGTPIPGNPNIKAGS